MSKSIVITLPHDLGAQEAKQRIASGLDRLRQDYVDKLAVSEVQWAGDRADLRIMALGQSVTAELEVMADSLRIEVHLPWFLAALANKIQGVLTNNAKESLRIGHTPKKT
jgi:hypothetical protein